jgi:predicted nuclease of predicted toxin-antitoxin system
MHKLLFDQNLSYRIIKPVEHLFPESNHVRLLDLDQADDATIWHYAKENDFHIVTQDSDFNNISALAGYPPKIIWIHIGNADTSTIIALFKKKHQLIQTFLEDEHAGLLELTG